MVNSFSQAKVVVNNRSRKPPVATLPIYQRSLIGALVLFALWEIAKHVLLMGLPMWLQHAFSTVLEIGLALVIVGVALRALAAQQRELDQTREARDRLTSALANDLREPLVAVVESLRELDGVTKLPSRTERAIKRATESVRPLVGMAVELLGVTSTEEAEEQFQVLSCAELLHAAVRTIQPVAAARQVEIGTDIAPDLPRIQGRPHSLLRVLMILLDNAVRVTPSGGEVSLITETGGSVRIYFQITDQGPPLSAEERQSLLQDGDENGKPMRMEGQTPRLGHRYCATMLKAHGGNMLVASAEEKGNIVTISLPIGEAPAA